MLQVQLDLDYKELLVLRDQQDLQEHKACQVQLALKVLLALLVKREHKDQQVVKEFKVLQDHKVPLVIKVQSDQQDLKDPLAHKEMLGLKDLPDQ